MFENVWYNIVQIVKTLLPSKVKLLLNLFIPFVLNTIAKLEVETKASLVLDKFYLFFARFWWFEEFSVSDYET